MSLLLEALKKAALKKRDRIGHATDESPESKGEIKSETSSDSTATKVAKASMEDAHNIQIKTARDHWLEKGSTHKNLTPIAEGSLDETAEGSLGEIAEGSLDETAEGSLDETAEGSLDEIAEGSLDETAEGSLDETDEGSLEEIAEGSLEEIAEGSLEEIAEGSLEEIAEGSNSQGSDEVECSDDAFEDDDFEAIFDTDVVFYEEGAEILEEHAELQLEDTLGHDFENVEFENVEFESTDLESTDVESTDDTNTDDVNLDFDEEVAREDAFEVKRAAMRQLLSRSQQVVAKARRRGISLYIALFITSFGCVGAYYYYLSKIDYSIQIAKLRMDDGFERDEQKSQNKKPIVVIERTVVAPNLVAPLYEQAVVENAADENSIANSVAMNADIQNTVVSTQGDTPEQFKNLNQGQTESIFSENVIANKIVSRRIVKPTTLNAILSKNIQAAYEAYQLERYELANVKYAAALKMSPRDRDALLGAAAVAVKDGRWQDAFRFYQSRLEDAPADEFARAGLLSLTSKESSDKGLKSELLQLLKESPNAAYLYFLKGTIHINGREWGAAQEAFFEAYKLDRSNPDYVYNLAVAMDHLGKISLAMQYYQTAIRLSNTRPASFVTAVTQDRIIQLQAVL